jgi:hypothetical protein
VTVNFWVLYSLIDPALIEDTQVLQDHVPSWMNHSLHTCVLLFTLTELLLTHRRYPRWAALGKVMSAVVVLGYTAWWVNTLRAVRQLHRDTRHLVGCQTATQRHTTPCGLSDSYTETHDTLWAVSHLHRDTTPCGLSDSYTETHDTLWAVRHLHRDTRHLVGCQTPTQTHTTPCGLSDTYTETHDTLWAVRQLHRDTTPCGLSDSYTDTRHLVGCQTATQRHLVMCSSYIRHVGNRACSYKLSNFKQNLNTSAQFINSLTQGFIKISYGIVECLSADRRNDRQTLKNRK